MTEPAPRTRPSGAWIAPALVAWLAGIGLHLQLAELWPADAFQACTALGCLFAVVGWLHRRLVGAAVLGAALLAFGLAGLQATAGLADRLDAGLEGRDVVVIGLVASLPQRAPDGLRFRFEPESATLDGHAVRLPGALAIGWYATRPGARDRMDPGARPVRPSPRAGERWRLAVRLKRPHGSLNPAGFDVELQLFEQGIGATGYVRESPVPRRLDEAAGHPVERLRQRVRDAIEARVPDRRAAGVLAALAVGDQGAIDHDDWDLYRNAGIAHLVSISGLHITMFAWLAGALIGRAWRRCGPAMLRLPAPLAARWGGVACAGAYAVFSGWGVPSQRTVWMLATVTLLQALGLRWPWSAVLLAAAGVVTAIDPWALTQAGFWLSFAAVGLLMASSPVRAGSDEQPVGGPAAEPASAWRRGFGRIGAQIRADLRTQVIATVGLTPLTLVIFQQVAVLGFVANLVAIPAITLVITPLALLGIGWAPLWTLGASAVGALNTLLALLASGPAAVWRVAVAPPAAQAAGLLAALLLLLPWPWRARLLALPLVVPLLLPAGPRPPPGRFDLIALDVGQGTGVVVRTREHLLVFDAGPQYAADSDAGARVVLPLLRARGEPRIDRLVLSHRDLDHVGGAAALLGAMPVDELLSSLEDGHPLIALAPRARRCVVGQAWEWDGVRFEIFRPQAEDYRRVLPSNAMSCVLRVDDGHRSVLLTGDIEREQEAALLAGDHERLRSQVLIVPHHGSKTSSTGVFLDAVAPRIAVVQAGYRNRFGHPAAEVMQRYRDRGIAVRSSPDCGAWLLPADGPDDGICLRDARRRYWHAASSGLGLR